MRRGKNKNYKNKNLVSRKCSTHCLLNMPTQLNI